MSNMSKIKVGITGTIGSGKSTVTKFISELYPTISADEIVSDLYKNKDFTSLVNKEILQVNSDILNKELLAKEIFSNKDSLDKINKLIHPKVKKSVKAWLSLQSGLCFVEVPLLYEANFQDLFDFIIVVLSDEKKILRRLKKDRGYSESEVLARIKSQMPAQKKKALANYVIYNNHSLIALKNDTLKVVKILEKEVDNGNFRKV